MGESQRTNGVFPMNAISGGTRSTLREQWWESLSEIADLALQRRKWLDPQSANPHWSYIEFACSYPDALMLREAETNGILSSSEATIFLKFGQVLNAYLAPHGNDYGHQAILNDPAWHKVVKAAKVAMETLDLPSE
jgi:hypothetical protein